MEMQTHVPRVSHVCVFLCACVDLQKHRGRCHHFEPHPESLLTFMECEVMWLQIRVIVFTGTTPAGCSSARGGVLRSCVSAQDLNATLTCCFQAVRDRCISVCTPLIACCCFFLETLAVEETLSQLCSELQVIRAAVLAQGRHGRVRVRKPEAKVRVSDLPPGWRTALPSRDPKSYVSIEHLLCV